MALFTGVEACTLLIRHRADINQKNRAGQKPLHIAKSLMLLQRNELIQILTHGLPCWDAEVTTAVGVRWQFGGSDWLVVGKEGKEWARRESDLKFRLPVWVAGDVGATWGNILE
eukprot:Skav211118  [mRNA]  locus=scaffold2659:19054:21438:- [translate_table: standard]